MEISADYVAQRMQCSRVDKQDLLTVIGQLMELGNHAYSFGLLEMDKRLHEDPVRFCDPFLRKAISVVVDMADPVLCKDVLYTYMLSGNYSGQQFLKNMIIVQAALAFQAHVQMDHIFSFVIPGYFGLDFEPYIIRLYRDFKISRGLGFDEEDLPDLT